MELFKVQTSHGNKRVLIYNENHSLFAVVQDAEVVDEVVTMLGMEPLTKVYVPAAMDKDGSLLLDPDAVLRDPEAWPEW